MYVPFHTNPSHSERKGFDKGDRKDIQSIRHGDEGFYNLRWLEEGNALGAPNRDSHIQTSPAQMLIQVAQELGESLTDEDLHEMLHLADGSNSGSVVFADFLKLMRTQE